MGKYLTSVNNIQSKCREASTNWPHAKYFPVQPKLSLPDSAVS